MLARSIGLSVGASFCLGVISPRALFAGALLDFKAAVERHDKSEAHLHYALVFGLICGAASSGAINKQAGHKLLIPLEETRAALMDAFGEAPKVSAPSIN